MHLHLNNNPSKICVSLTPNEVAALFSIMEKSSPVGQSCKSLTWPEKNFSRSERNLINQFNRSKLEYVNELLIKPIQ